MRAFIEALINRARSVISVMLIILVTGVLAYNAVPRESDPDIPIPVFTVSVAQNGISAQDAEILLLKPLEEELRDIEGLKSIVGTAVEGYSIVVLTFEADFDAESAFDDVRESTDRAKAELPEDAKEPLIREFNVNLFPILNISVIGNVSNRLLYRTANALKDSIESIGTVLSVDISGERDELVEIIIDPVAIDSYDINASDLLSAVSANNRLIAAGKLKTANGTYPVKVPGLIKDYETISNIPLKAYGDQIITLADIGHAKQSFVDPQRYSRVNGKPSVTLSVVKRLGANLIETSAEIRRLVAEHTRQWPPELGIVYSLDEAEPIQTTVQFMQSSVMTAILLVMILIIATLGLRSGLLVGLAVPTSFLIAFIVLWAMDQSLNIMILFGLILCVGILVDSAIVMVEFADQRMSAGVDRKIAFAEAVERMFWPIISSTFTTLAAFFPLLFWPGVSGQFMSYLPMTVIIVLLGSLMTALIFVPVLGAYCGGIRYRAAQRAAANLPPQSTMVLLYQRLLYRLLKAPTIVLTSMMIMLAIIIILFAQYNRGVQFFVTTEPEFAFVYVSSKGDLSVADMHRLTLEVEEVITTVDGIETILSISGGSSDIVRNNRDPPADAIGVVQIELADYKTRRPGTVILDEIRARTSHIAGIAVEIVQRQGGPPVGKDIQVEILSDNFDDSMNVAVQVRDYLRRNVSGVRDFEDSLPPPGIEWNIEIDRYEAARFGANIAIIGAMVQLVTNGVLIGTYRPADSDKEIDIRARFAEQHRSLSALRNLNIQTSNGVVPLSNFVKIEPKHKISRIKHRNARVLSYVKANVETGVNVNEKIQQIKAWAANLDLPPGTQISYPGADEAQNEAFNFLIKAMLGSLFLMFIFLLTQFNRFYHTLLILLTVALSAVGVLVGLLLTGQIFSVIMTGTGIVTLAGIVVNNAIVLLDTYNHTLRRGLAGIDAIVIACSERLRPILLTTITTICGLIPTALQFNIDFFNRTFGYGEPESLWWVQMATAIIFGLAFSTILTLIMLPALLILPDSYAHRLQLLKSRWQHRRDVQANLPDNPAIS